MPRLPSLRQLSCGIVIVNPGRELLLCHVTGQHHWDLPKGGSDPGESPRAAALRETREETGLLLDADRLEDLGRHRYTARKDLHLFALCVPRFDLAALHCSTHYVDRTSGRSLPEMDGYAWFGFERVGSVCASSMAQLLRHSIDLDRRVSTLAPGTASPLVSRRL